MRKLDNFSPEILINRLSIDSCNYLQVFVDAPTESSLRSPKIIRLEDTFSEIELDFEGFDMISKNSHGQEFISGDIYLVSKYEATERKYILASPKILTLEKHQSHKRKKISSTASLIQLSKEIKSEWQASFADALDDASTPISRSATPISSKTMDAKWKNKITDFFSLSGPLGIFVKIVLTIMILNATGYIAISLYNKTLQAKNIKNTAQSLDPVALAKNQTDIVDETFKEMGIDRNKLTSDLSCFAEE